MNPSVTTIIVTHNNQETILSCLSSLQQHHCNTIIIIDNGSTDDTSKLIASHQGIQNNHNLGFAAAVNQAAQLVTTDYIFLINPDATLTTSIKPALEYLQQHPQVAAAGLALVDANGHPEPHSWSPHPVTPLSLFTRKTHLLGPSPHVNHYNGAVPAAWVSAGAIIIRRSAFEQLKGFDPTFFLYWEDVDFCRRLTQAHYKIVYFPHLSVQHQRGHSLSNTGRKAAIYDNSADRYFKKHYPAYIWWPLQQIRRIYRYFSPQSH